MEKFGENMRVDSEMQWKREERSKKQLEMAKKEAKNKS